MCIRDRLHTQLQLRPALFVARLKHGEGKTIRKGVARVLMRVTFFHDHGDKGKGMVETDLFKSFFHFLASNRIKMAL